MTTVERTFLSAFDLESPGHLLPGNRMRNLALPADTTIEAARVQAMVWQRLSMEKRLGMLSEMIDNGRKMTEWGVRQRHPHYTETEVRLAGIRLRLGEDLFHKAYPGHDVLP